ncbi:MAG: LamG domain-containing protein [Saprospiraceae bacterium]|nr:LamG domain-containing protein [Saprospiraceae bacterium]
MIKKTKLQTLFIGLLGLLGSQHVVGQCTNLAMAFDGNGDFISRDLTTTTPVMAGNIDFTIEAWFYSSATSVSTSCIGNYKRLIGLVGPPGSGTRLEVGECGGELNLYWNNSTSSSVVPILLDPNNIRNNWHHIAVTRNSSTNTVKVYLDCLPLTFNGATTGAFNFSELRIGRWGGGGSPPDEWEGRVDEVRLWDRERTSTEICDFKDCTLGGNSPDLVFNWTFDQTPAVVADGPNPLGTQAVDMTSNGNDGTLVGFNLATVNSTSNFVCSDIPPAYFVNISDQPSLFPVSLAVICSGEAMHFCAVNQNASGPLPPNSTVIWEYNDNNTGWLVDPNLNPTYSGYLCFGVPGGVITANCGATGYVDRLYRAIITKPMGNLTCTYTTLETGFRIYCPVTNIQVNTVVNSPTPFNGAFCEGPVNIDVSLSSTDPFVIPPAIPPTGDLSIQWCINGVHDPTYDNMVNFNYSMPATPTSLCFEAKVQNFVCSPVTAKVCFNVDPQPVCGLIDGMSTNLIATPNPYAYLICPGDDAAVGMVNPAQFVNCNAVWQFSFDLVNWQNLGASNALQNTNILPQTFPPNNPLSPYLWPAGANCIYYRIECRPLSYPNSGCDPCYSNIVEVCLLPPPANGLISGNQQFCSMTGSTTLTVNPYNSANTYSWYLNGVGPVGFGQNYSANQPGYYTVVITDAYGCHSVVTPPFYVEECIIVPLISCPIDNPCACDGLPITLSGCDSYDTCGGTGPYTYTWSASNGGPGTVSGPGGCEFTHIPDPVVGTTYTLTVCNSLNPSCCATSTLFIKPCN